MVIVVLDDVEGVGIATVGAKLLALIGPAEPDVIVEEPGDVDRVLAVPAVVLELLLCVDVVDSMGVAKVKGSVLVAFSVVGVTSIDDTSADTVVDGSNMVVVAVCVSVVVP